MNLDEIQRTHHTKNQIKLDEFQMKLDEIEMKFRRILEKQIRQNLDKIWTNFRQNLELVRD